MKIKYFCAWWGLSHLGLEGMIRKIKTAGFDGIESFVPFEEEERALLKSLLKKYELEIIAHQFQADGDFETYRTTFRESLMNAASIEPLFINSHTGRDYWPVSQNEELIAIGNEVAAATGVNVLHETHRGRFLFSGVVSKTYFERNPGLKVTADFSHWVCVSESMLEGQEEVLAEAIRRAAHIHARVGYEEGPQVPDPRNGLWSVHLKKFTAWWQRIVDRFVEEGHAYLTITPEFGPAPYAAINPEDGQSLFDIFEINCWMKDYLKENLHVGRNT